MSASVSMFMWFMAIAALSAAAGAFIHMAVRADAVTIATRLGVAFAGASLGVFGGALLAQAYNLEGLLMLGTVTAVAVVCAVAFQQNYAAWFGGNKPQRGIHPDGAASGGPAA